MTKHTIPPVTEYFDADETRWIRAEHNIGGIIFRATAWYDPGNTTPVLTLAIFTGNATIHISTTSTDLLALASLLKAHATHVQNTTQQLQLAAIERA